MASDTSANGRGMNPPMVKRDVRTLRLDLQATPKAALRSLVRQPAVCATVAIVLGLGIGVCTAMFSAVRGVLVHSVPYARHDELVQITSAMPKQGLTQILIALPRFEIYAAQARSFTGLAAFARQDFFLTMAGTPISVPGARVSQGFFRTLEITPIRGRDFSAEEQARGGPHAAIIDERFWKGQLGGTTDVVGRTISINGEAVAIVGVVPARFAPPLQDAEVWLPRIYEPDFVPPEQVERGNGYLRVIGRLAPGVGPSDAQKELQQVVADYRSRFGALRDAAFDAAVDPLATYLFGDVHDTLIFLWLAGMLVFLIACANAGNVLRARITTRRAELDIRSAVGATRRQVVFQLLMECALLAAGGVAIGVLFAIGVDVWLASLAGGVLSTNAPFSFDPLVFIAAVALGTLALLIAGAVPAIQATGEHRSSHVLSGTRHSTIGSATARWRRGFVIAQVAVSYALLASAMQQVSALRRVQRLDRGFDPHRLTTFQIAPSALKYPAPESRAELYRRIEEGIAQAPGISAVGSSQAMPAGDDQTIAFIPEADRARKPEEWPHAQFRMVSNGYFKALGVAVRRGRGFSALDSKEANNVAVINEALAHAQFGSVDPVGQRIFLGSNATPKEIVGVIADVRQRWLIPESQPEVHIPEAQMWVRLPPMYFFVRSSLSTAALAATIRSQVAGVDPIQAVTRVRSMDAVAAEGLAVARMRATLIAGFALLGMVLATVGLWSVMSQLVAERTPELGIRTALGAQPIATIAYVLRSGVWTTTIGVVIGLVCALSLSRISQSLLTGIESPDIIVLIGAGLLLVAIGGAATLLPATRAARINPVEAMTRR